MSSRTDPKVAVLMGGFSAEREVSLVTGAAVLAALQARGIDAHSVDPSETSLDVLHAEGYQRIAPLADRILSTLRSQDGKLAVNEASSPEEIRAAFQTSKKAFKQAVGNLYRERLIEINGSDIVLRNAGVRSVKP